ncbi:hypothetical protein F5144DRAFT_43242 [Chaetomium tenue]|uniref:Uncharacterized protein n=1 Tax=Chaetomium tenue TaxID=1854479 RepID=A0ACB7PNE7_9PEZI|nr:hypothetical protein F5144DRAFT_43242 [Chaetomium globosum]
MEKVPRPGGKPGKCCTNGKRANLESTKPAEAGSPSVEASQLDPHARAKAKIALALAANNIHPRSSRKAAGANSDDLLHASLAQSWPILCTRFFGRSEGARFPRSQIPPICPHPIPAIWSSAGDDTGCNDSRTACFTAELAQDTYLQAWPHGPRVTTWQLSLFHPSSVQISTRRLLRKETTIPCMKPLSREHSQRSIGSRGGVGRCELPHVF